MKTLVALCAFGVVLSGAASADTIQNGYGNSFVVTTAAGATLRYHFSADHSFDIVAPDGSVAARGTYEIAGDQLCLTPAGGDRGCVNYNADKKVGDTWQQIGSDGTQITVSLVAGH